jgi:hypothetical protein
MPLSRREARLPVQSRMPVPACAEEALAELAACAAALSAASGGNLLAAATAAAEPSPWPALDGGGS